jgi:uncharacterized protein DUF3568
MQSRLTVWKLAAAFALFATLPACAPVAVTAIGVGASAGIQHTVSGIAYRTFSAPLPDVRAAVREALDYMKIRVGSTWKIDNGVRFKARASDLEIEIDLEVLTPNATRMRSTARNGLLMDSATATEIIRQTLRALAAQPKEAG